MQYHSMRLKGDDHPGEVACEMIQAYYVIRVRRFIVRHFTSWSCDDLS